MKIEKTNKILLSMSKEFIKVKKEIQNQVQKVPKIKSKTYDLER